MSKIGLQVAYWHPRTEFRLRATHRTAVTQEGGASRLRPVVDVDLHASVVPDLAARQEPTFEVGLLEKFDVQLGFDDRGLLESLNAESGRDVTPVISLVGKVVALAATFGVVEPVEPPPLEEQWAADHPRLAELGQGLTARIDGLLRRLVAADTTAAETVDVGAALAVLEGYQAAIGRARREWIAARAGVVSEQEWRLRPAELLLVPGVTELPDGLTDPELPAAQATAGAGGVLLAVADALRPARATPPGPPVPDVIRLRGSRPAQAGVYLRGDDGWSLQRDSVLDLDLVDEFSPDNTLALDGSWLATRQFTIAFHPDKSLKTFGVSRTPTATPVAAAVGGLLGDVAGAASTWAARPTATARELDRVTTQLDLARTENELDVLTATRSRATELAVLEQEKQLRDARS